MSCAVAALALAPAWAQRPISPGNVAPGSPGIASPLPGDVIPQGSPIPRALPPGLPGVSAGPGIGAAAPAPVPSGSVAIRAVRIEGATAYVPAQTQDLLAGLVGPSVPLSRIEMARTALLNRYRGDGYGPGSYGRGPRFSTVCATARGSCPIRPVPQNSPCGCEIPGFGYKRGAAY